jgi:hypothetical protein
MNIHVKLSNLPEPEWPEPDWPEPDRPESDAGLQASAWGRAIADEVREVAWLSFVVATLSMAGAGLGIVLALALDGYLV